MHLENRIPKISKRYKDIKPQIFLEIHRIKDLENPEKTKRDPKVCYARQTGIRDDTKGSSKKERRANALALRAEEGRDQLRKASGRSTYPLIRGCPNGETRKSIPLTLHNEYIVMQGEPPELKHLSRARKRKKHRFPK